MDEMTRRRPKRRKIRLVRRSPVPVRKRKALPKSRRLAAFRRRRRRPLIGLVRSRRPVIVVNRPSLPGRPVQKRQPALPNFTSRVRRSLRQAGLAKGIWLVRLARADPRLTNFINLFHDVAGFELIIRDYFSGAYKRAVTVLAMGFAQKVANRLANFAYMISFARAIQFAPGALPTRTVTVVYKGVHYQFLPWPKLFPLALRQQFSRDAILFGNPNLVRWVFDGRRLSMKKTALVTAIRRLLSDTPAPLITKSVHRHWLTALGTTIVVAQ